MVERRSHALVQPEEVVGSVDSLPRLPEVLVRLYDVAQDPATTGKTVADIVHVDPGLTANLLRSANVAAYGVAQRVTSVEHAVAFLGLKRVFQLALTAGLSSVVPPHLNGYGIGAIDYAMHSVTVGVLADRLAKALGLQFQDSVFTAGLLHDIGKLAVSTFLEEYGNAVRAHMRLRGILFVEAEKDVLGTDHTEVGAMMAERWGLPPAIVWAAQWHHHPERAPKTVDAQFVGVVHAANKLAYHVRDDMDDDELQELVNKAAWSQIQLTLDNAKDALRGTPGEVKALAHALHAAA